MSYNPFHYLYVLCFGLAALCFALHATDRFNYNLDAAGKMFIALALLFLLVK